MASFIKFETILIVFSLILIQIVFCRLFDKSRSSNVLSKESQSNLQECNGDLAICGMVQYNNWGIFSQPICRCKERFNPELNSITSGSCPLNWDPNDGQTHIHAFDQYKFCGQAPDLKTCRKDQPAYLTLGRIDRLTGARLENTHLLLCNCPVGHILLQDTKNIKFFDFEEQSVQLIHQFCSPVPTCTENQICAAVTQTANSTLVRKNCKCPSSSICPASSLDFAVDKQEFRKGSVYTYKCISNQ